MYKNDIKKTWSVINSTFSRNKKCNASELFIIYDKELKDPTVIANEFNKYFVNIGQCLAEKITHDFNFYLKNRIDSQLRFTLVDEEHVVGIFNRLKNKSIYGCDNISNKLLKYAKAFLIKPLTLLINQTLSTGIFPNELKISRVRPLFKNGDTSNSYRPISILPSISKIFEYVIFHQLFDYMSHNAQFCHEQFGFRTGHSTELASLQLTDYLIKQMDQGSTPLNIYISKAFDTLDHSILLSKLSYYGITGCEDTLFVSYLSNRYQYVEYNNAQYVTTLITTGVPQGSILSPLLFYIYINDFPKVSAFLTC